MKTALLMAAVEPRIGGVMVFGDRGTGKSTAARALAEILPPIRVVDNCRFHCDPEDRDACPDPCTSHKVRKMAVPFVDLPLGSTEDRVVGTLDLEQALAHGRKRFEPGLLAKAHRGFLYIDEINLLGDCPFIDLATLHKLLQVVLDILDTGLFTLLEGNQSVRTLAPFFIGHTHHGSAGDGRMLADQVFQVQ